MVCLLVLEVNHFLFFIGFELLVGVPFEARYVLFAVLALNKAVWAGGAVEEVGEERVVLYPWNLRFNFVLFVQLR